MRFLRSWWSWQPRHLSLDSALVSLTWQSLHFDWSSSAPCSLVSAPGDDDMKLWLWASAGRVPPSPSTNHVAARARKPKSTVYRRVRLRIGLGPQTTTRAGA